MAEITPKRTLRGFLDGVVRFFAFGMGLEELRAILRGDPPTAKPNPRYKAHTNSLLLHIRPRYYQKASTWFTHTFRLGFFTMFFFIVEGITGFILMIYYVPTPEGAYPSILRLLTNVPFGELLRDIHRLAGEGMVIFTFLHMLRTFLTGSYKKERAFTWVTGVALFLLTLFLAFSGYLLPWDQIAYWAITIGTSIIESIPIIGPELSVLLRGSTTIGADGLLRFYQLHVIFLPLLAGILIGVHYYQIARRHNISLPAYVEEGNLPPEKKAEATRRVDFIPDLLLHEWFMVSLGLLALVSISLFFYDAPLEQHADPFTTPFEAEAPWFFLWVQGLLKLGDKTLLGIVLPAVVILILFLLPYIDRNPRRMLRKRPVALGIAVVALVALGVLSYMGTPGYGIHIPPAARISQHLAPDEGIGPLHQVPFEAFEPGVYIVNSTSPDELPDALASVFTQYSNLLNEAKIEMPEMQAFFIVEDWQVDLKRITLRMIWRNPDTEERITYEHFIHLHNERAMPDDLALEEVLP